MHLFNAKRLSDQLRADAVSEAEKYRYFWVLLLLQSLSRALSRSSDPTHLLATVLFALVSIVGLSVCFKANQRGDNHRFLERFICLAVPLRGCTQIQKI